jgi:hypothetical protein
MSPRSIKRPRHPAHRHRVRSPLFQWPLTRGAGIRDGRIRAKDRPARLRLRLRLKGEGDLGCLDGGDFFWENEEVWFCRGDWVWEGVGEDVREDEGEFGLEVKVG